MGEREPDGAGRGEEVAEVDRQPVGQNRHVEAVGERQGFELVGEQADQRGGGRHQLDPVGQSARRLGQAADEFFGHRKHGDDVRALGEIGLEGCPERVRIGGELRMIPALPDMLRMFAPALVAFQTHDDAVAARGERPGDGKRGPVIAEQQNGAVLDRRIAAQFRHDLGQLENVVVERRLGGADVGAGIVHVHDLNSLNRMTRAGLWPVRP